MANRQGLLKRCDCPTETKCPHPWYIKPTIEGKPKWISLAKHVKRTGDTRNPAILTEAQQIAADIRAQIHETGAYTPRRPASSTSTTSTTMTFDALVEKFTETHEDSGCESWADDIGKLKKLSRVDVPDLGRFGAVTLDQITGVVVAEVFKTTKPYANGTRKKYRRNLRRVFSFAVDEGLMSASPITDRIAKTKLKSGADFKRKERCRPDRERDLLTACRETRCPDDGQRVADLIVTAIETGARRGELLALKWRDINDHDITIRAEEVGARKTKTPRRVPLTPRVREVLGSRRLDPTGRKFRADDYVFGTITGEKVANIKKAWLTIVLRAHNQNVTWTKTAVSAESRKALKLINLHFHDLRHEAAWRWHEGKTFDGREVPKLPIAAIAKILGHKDLGQLATYLGADLDDALDAHRAIYSPPPTGENPPAQTPTEKTSSKRVANAKSLRLVASRKVG